MSKTINFTPDYKKKSIPAGTLYDLNKQIIKDIKPLTELEIAGIQSKLSEWFNMIIDTYAMLLCHERRDYTIFHLYETQNQDPPAVAANELIGCLTDRGSYTNFVDTLMGGFAMRM